MKIWLQQDLNSMCFISTSPRFNYDVNIYFHLSQMQFAGPEEIDDGSKTPRVAIKIKLVILENIFSTK